MSTPLEFVPGIDGGDCEEFLFGETSEQSSSTGEGSSTPEMRIAIRASESSSVLLASSGSGPEIARISISFWEGDACLTQVGLTACGLCTYRDLLQRVMSFFLLDPSKMPSDGSLSI